MRANKFCDHNINKTKLRVTCCVPGVQGLWLEMAIVADHTMLKFHGRERVKHYILALMNIVSIALVSNQLYPRCMSVHIAYLA